jgi:hypothetical protein
MRTYGDEFRMNISRASSCLRLDERLSEEGDVGARLRPDGDLDRFQLDSSRIVPQPGGQAEAMVLEICRKPHA